MDYEPIDKYRLDIKERLKPLLYSALVPGLGQYHNGKKIKALLFPTGFLVKKFFADRLDMIWEGQKNKIFCEKFLQFLKIFAP